MKNKFNRDKFYMCECGIHVLRIVSWWDEETLSIMKYSSDNSNYSLFQRLELAIGYIFKPEKYDIHGDIMLSKDIAEKLGKDLIEFSKKRKGGKIMSNHRNDLKELFKKYGINSAIRSNTLNDLVDEINKYYVDGDGNSLINEFHEKHLKKQLISWIKFLNNQKDKLEIDSEYTKGIKMGMELVIKKLNDVTKQ